MNLLHLRYFAALAETENMTETAGQLGISRSNLSIAISKLETELGVELLEKAGRGVRLSKNGQKFYARLKGPLAELDLAIRETTRREDLSVMVGIPVMWSQPIAEFAAQRPDIRVGTRQVSPRQVETFFAEQGFDFWLTGTDPAPFAALLDAQKLHSAPLVLAVHKGHALAGRESVSIKELKDESFIFTTNEYTLRDVHMKICRENGFEPKVVDYAVFDNRIRAVARGKGVSFIDYAEKENTVFRDISLLKVHDVPFRNYYICSPKGRSLSPNAEDFLAFIKSYYKRR